MSKDGTCLTVLFQMKRSACFCSTRSVNDGCVCEGRNRVRGVLDAAELPEYKVTKQYKVINAPWTFKLPRERSSGHTVREAHLVCTHFHVAWWPSWVVSLSVLTGGGFERGQHSHASADIRIVTVPGIGVLRTGPQTAGVAIPDPHAARLPPANPPTHALC